MKKLSTQIVVLSTDATKQLNNYLKNYKNILLVCDENTYKFNELIEPEHNYYIYPPNVHATPEESSELDSIDCDVMIACGAGTIHDITRYAAHKRNIPFISYPTAASVDGFVSNIAAMTVDGRKKTLPSTPPIALFADPAVFSTAPKRYTVSGICDIIGKYISLFDWKFASLLTGEELDFELIKMLEDILEKIKNPENIIDIMEGLINSGMVIQLHGNSRPASGAEHHLSHFWEMNLLNDETGALHGEKVGVATLMMLEKYKSADKIVLKNKPLDHKYLELVFGPLTDGIIEENTPSPLDELSQEVVDEKIPEIRALIEELPDVETIKKYYEKIGAPQTLRELGLPDDEEFIKKTFEFAPYVRKRLTLLKIL